MNLIDEAKDLLHDRSLRGCVQDRVMALLRALAALEPSGVIVTNGGHVLATTHPNTPHAVKDYLVEFADKYSLAVINFYTLETRHE